MIVLVTGSHNAIMQYTTLKIMQILEESGFSTSVIPQIDYVGDSQAKVVIIQCEDIRLMNYEYHVHLHLKTSVDATLIIKLNETKRKHSGSHGTYTGYNFIINYKRDKLSAYHCNVADIMYEHNGTMDDGSTDNLINLINHIRIFANRNSK